MSPPLLLHVFPTFSVGGAQVRFAALANRFGRSWRHAIVSLDGASGCAARLSPELDVTFPQFIARKGDLLGNLRAIWHLLSTLRPDIMVTSNWGSIEWAIANSVPSPFAVRPRHIHTEDGFGPEERATQLPRRVMTRRVALRRSAVVLPSRTLLRIATEGLAAEPSQPSLYSPMGSILNDSRTCRWRMTCHVGQATVPLSERWPPCVRKRTSPAFCAPSTWPGSRAGS